MHMYLYVYINICIYICIFIYTYMYIHICIRVCKCICLCMCMCIYMCIHVCVRNCMYLYTKAHAKAPSCVTSVDVSLLQKRPIILRSLLIAATPYPIDSVIVSNRVATGSRLLKMIGLFCRIKFLS